MAYPPDAAVPVHDPGQEDIIDILHWSEENFGQAARERYAALIATAVREVAAAPEGIGSTDRSELGESVRSWHLRESRHHASGPMVRRPRHVVFYAVNDGEVLIVRILHDAMEPSRHLGPDRSDE